MKSTSIDAWRAHLEARAGSVSNAVHHEPPMVTISREACAGATTVAYLVADLLNRKMPGPDAPPWTVFDHNLIERVLQDHRLPQIIEKFMPEDAAVFSPVKVVEEFLGLHPSEWTLAQHTTDTIRKLARIGNVILVGRGANVIASGQKEAFSVRLVAPKDERIRRAMGLYHLGEKEAGLHVAEKDRARKRYLKIYFKVAIDDPYQYHAVLNTGRLSYEETARLIAEAVIFRHR